MMISLFLIVMRQDGVYPRKGIGPFPTVIFFFFFDLPFSKFQVHSSTASPSPLPSDPLFPPLIALLVDPSLPSFSLVKFSCPVVESPDCFHYDISQNDSALDSFLNLRFIESV